MACAFILFLLYYSGLQDLQEVQCRMLAFGLAVSVNLIGLMSTARKSVGFSSWQSRIRGVLFQSCVKSHCKYKATNAYDSITKSK